MLTCTSQDSMRKSDNKHWQISNRSVFDAHFVVLKEKKKNLFFQWNYKNTSSQATVMRNNTVANLQRRLPVTADFREFPPSAKCCLSKTFQHVTPCSFVFGSERSVNIVNQKQLNSPTTKEPALNLSCEASCGNHTNMSNPHEINSCFFLEN